MKLIRKITNFYYRLRPLVKNSVYFSSYTGQYSCNPKFISLKLHELAPDICIYWAKSDVCHDVFPQYVTPININSHMAVKLRFTCNVTVDNYCGTRLQCTPQVFRYIKWIGKKENQLSISTWHGTPLKKMGLDDFGSNLKIVKEQLLLTDYLIAGCQHTASVLARCSQRIPYPVSLTGTPRNDILCNKNAIDINSLKNKLGLPYDKKIILFAPTFRDSIEQSGVAQMKMIDVKQVLDQCAACFGGEWVFVLRVHNMVLLSIDASRYETDLIINGNKGDDMAEYLACTDILITDYSGSMFDFALTGRPCFLFAPDREHYEKQERGFYLDYDSLPFPISYTNDQLIGSINTFDEISYRHKVKKFLGDIGNIEDGKASERIAKCIVHFIKTGEKRLETVNGVDVR